MTFHQKSADFFYQKCANSFYPKCTNLELADFFKGFKIIEQTDSLYTDLKLRS